ncbi:Pex19 protein family-domain-containing protein [Xylaria telfairii]|nr:Pex19 protein family-domain-containing protein [Xylaria telfairii]
METDKAGIAGDHPKQPDQAPSIESKTLTSAEPKTVVGVNNVDDAPDPDEDDLDDLDDMLDEFSSVRLSSKPDVANTTAPAIAPAATTSTASTSVDQAPTDGALDAENSLPGLDDFSAEEFEKQLQAGMAELMGDLEGSVSGALALTSFLLLTELQPDLQAQFENIFKGLGAAEATGSNDESTSIPLSTGAMAADLSQDASFQETIRRTMARMQASGDQATAAATAEGSEDDFIAEMMKAMKDMPGGDGNDEDFSKLLMGMMEQLTNKEILYEPMKELNDKYPGWMEKNKDTLSKDDLKRYQGQQVLVAEMVARFEQPTYSDSNPADREYIVDRMQKMQAAGSPPHDLVGDMPSAKEVLDAPEDSCAPQ